MDEDPIDAFKVLSLATSTTRRVLTAQCAGVDRLYAVNTMARVRDDLCASPDGAPLDESMLITGVTFTGGRGPGCETNLVLVPKGSIRVIPQE